MQTKFLRANWLQTVESKKWNNWILIKQGSKTLSVVKTKDKSRVERSRFRMSGTGNLNETRGRGVLSEKIYEPERRWDCVFIEGRELLNYRHHFCAQHFLFKPTRRTGLIVPRLRRSLINSRILGGRQEITHQGKTKQPIFFSAVSFSFATTFPLEFLEGAK